MIHKQEIRIQGNIIENIGQSVRDRTAAFENSALLLVGLVNLVFERDASVYYRVDFTSDFQNEKKKIFAILESEEATAREAVNSINKTFDEPAEYGRGSEDGLYGIDFIIKPSAEGNMDISIEYDEEKHSINKINTVIGLLNLFAEQIAENPNVYLSELNKVTSEEAKRITESSAEKEYPIDRSKTWLDYFSENVKNSPDSLAVSADNGTYTYRELDNASNILALHLLDEGAVKGDFIGVELDRVKEYVTAVVAIHKAGCAFLPIDPAYPGERINFMIEDSGAKIILTEDEIEAVIKKGRPDDHERDTLPGADPEGKAYMIYTSGSTGKPKGVMIAHKSLLNYSISIKNLVGIKNSDRILAYRSFSFDAHIEDYFPTLEAGASVFILGEDKRRDYDEIVGFMRRNRITGGGFTTSVARTLMTEYELPMRFIIAGGEALYGVTGKPGLQIFNQYGPTECTGDVTWFPLETGVSYNNVPIGRPIPGNTCLILDKNEKLLPAGVAGELCVVGIQVGIGYNNRDDLTKKVFTECPYLPGERMYHTGDLVRYNEDGYLEFLGRIDNQVKLRGYRIELGEIEVVAGKHEGIKETVALVSDVHGGRHLILYYTVKNGTVVDESRFRDFMAASSLPDYMKPEIYMRLEKMPVLPNNKIDRRHMPVPENLVDIKGEQPQTALETHILDIAKEILPGMDFGVTDDLFELGMTSLSSMMFVSKINLLEYGLKYRVTDVMRYRTIRKLIAGKQRVFWNYGEYDKDKPMLVFIYGVATVARTLKMLKTISDHFNIFVIEQTDSHYDLLFKDADYDEVNDMYFTILENHLPKECKKVDGFMGFSWGGYVAYTLAASWAEEHGDKPFVLMGDTDFSDMLLGKRRKEYSITDFPKNLYDITGGTITLREVVKKLNMVGRLISTVKTIPKYDGPVIQLNALKYQEREKTIDEKRKNLEVIARYASNFKIIDFPEHTHDDLFYDDSQVDNYLNIMKDAMDIYSKQV